MVNVRSVLYVGYYKYHVTSFFDSENMVLSEERTVVVARVHSLGGFSAFLPFRLISHWVSFVNNRFGQTVYKVVHVESCPGMPLICGWKIRKWALEVACHRFNRVVHLLLEHPPKSVCYHRHLGLPHQNTYATVYDLKETCLGEKTSRLPFTWTSFLAVQLCCPLAVILSPTFSA